MSKPHQAAPAPANVVTVFRGDHLEPIIRNILYALDAALQVREHNEALAMKFDLLARIDLHDLLCEVVS